MFTTFRKIMFVFYAVFLRLPVWAIIWLVGRTGVFKTVFVIYPHDKEEYSKLCPDFQPFIRFMSGRPTPGGLILDGWRPVGIYLFISNTPRELIKKKNRPLAETIVRRMQWIQKIAGAKTIGFAGQLGPILERRHNVDMAPPFFSSTMGNVFSIEEALTHLAKEKNKHPWELSLGILGGGELGELLQGHFSRQGYETTIIDVKFKRRGGIIVKLDEAGTSHLDNLDFVINLLPTGEDFIECGIAEHLHAASSVIDFSRPAIPKEQLRQQVVMGNRVQRPGMRFAFSLPGDWRKLEIPACSMPSILAARFDVVENSLTNFCRAARIHSFGTALVPAVEVTPSPLSATLKTWAEQLLRHYRLSLNSAKSSFSK